MAETVEQKVSNAILQEKKVVKIGGVDYEIAPPSAAVWIKVSAMASEVPVKKLNEENIIGEIFRNAKHYEVVCRITAQMILGVINPVKNPLLSFAKQKSEVEKLAEKLVFAPPSELKQALNILFAHHEAGFFFATIAFLPDMMMTQPTRTEATASGQ